MSPTLPTSEVPLRSSDRCDSCTARALVRATRGSSILLLCGHHAEQHGDQLQADGWDLERPPLV